MAADMAARSELLIIQLYPCGYVGSTNWARGQTTSTITACLQKIPDVKADQRNRVIPVFISEYLMSTSQCKIFLTPQTHWTTLEHKRTIKKLEPTIIALLKCFFQIIHRKMQLI